MYVTFNWYDDSIISVIVENRSKFTMHIITITINLDTLNYFCHVSIRHCHYTTYETVTAELNISL